MLNFVLTITVMGPTGMFEGTRAMIWLGLLMERWRVVLIIAPSARMKNTPCDESFSSTLSLSPSMMMSSPMVIVPSFKPVAVSVMPVMRAVASFAPSLSR